MTPGAAMPVIVERDVACINGGDKEGLLDLFAPRAVVEHPSGSYHGADEIGAFYAGLAFRIGARITVHATVGAGCVAMAELRIDSTADLTMGPMHAANVYRLDDAGRIRALSIYYR